MLVAAALPAAAEPFRVAICNVELPRNGPGLLLRDILEGDPQVEAVAAVVARLDPDILLLIGVDWDLDGLALAALRRPLAEAGADYPAPLRRPAEHRHGHRARPGRRRRPATPRDAQGYGRFAGEGGMALLSRLPIGEGDVRDFSDLLWRDLPGAELPRDADGAPFFPPRRRRCSGSRPPATGTCRWSCPRGSEIRVWAFHATPPVFDGPEDLNGLRNRDEARSGSRYLDGAVRSATAPTAAFVLLGDANLDPADGDGRPDAIEALLADPRLQDPRAAQRRRRRRGRGAGRRQRGPRGRPGARHRRLGR